jgi:tyrosyl-tRNA synthetase
MTLSEELTWRGFVNQTTFKNTSELDRKKRTFYFGVDPSAPSAQIGNFAAMMMCRLFIRYGYNPILLLGGATGRIGDPKDTEERDLKPEEEVDSNVQAIAEQYKKVFGGNNFTLVNNYDWFKNINYLDFLRDIGKKFSMSQMLDREFVKARVGEGKSGLSYAEFSYSLIQGYDFLHLFKDFGATLQLCGSDQWGNSISGVDLIRKELGEEAHVWSLPLVIDATTGRKFGKSEGGMTLWLDPKMTSPYKLYQFWLNVSDENIENYLKIFTDISPAEFDELMLEFNENKTDRAAQKYLAFEVTKLVHGEDIAKSVRRISEVLFSGRDASELTKDDFEALSLELPKSNKSDILDFMIETEMAKSKGEARRLIEQNSVSVNGQKIDDIELKLNGNALVKKGKNVFGIFSQK